MIQISTRVAPTGRITHLRVTDTSGAFDCEEDIPIKAGDDIVLEYKAGAPVIRVDRLGSPRWIWKRIVRAVRGWLP